MNNDIGESPARTLDSPAGPGALVTIHQQVALALVLICEHLKVRGDRPSVEGIGRLQAHIADVGPEDPLSLIGTTKGLLARACQELELSCAHHQAGLNLLSQARDNLIREWDSKVGK